MLIVALLALLALLLLCGAGAWGAHASSVRQLVVAGARGVEVETRGLGDLRVTYHVEGQAYGWRDMVWQQLLSNGWRGRDYTFGTTLRFTVTSYRRERNLGPLQVVENAVVGGDPDDPGLVIIEFHRRLRLRDGLWPW